MVLALEVGEAGNIGLFMVLALILCVNAWNASCLVISVFVGFGWTKGASGSLKIVARLVILQWVAYHGQAKVCETCGYSARTIWQPEPEIAYWVRG